MPNKHLIRVASTNIRFANPADKNNDWQFRKSFWAKLINDFAPDFIATQEGRQPQLLEAQEVLDKLNLIHEHREWITERMYPCIFFNPLKMDVVSSGDAWLSQTPLIAGTKSFESAFPRLCTWACLKHKEYNKEIFVINTHLDHVKDETRSQQIEVVIQTIKKENYKSLPVILCGDFNEDPSGEVRNKINRQLNLKDPWIIFDKAEETTHHKFCGFNDDGARIDWILCSDEFNPKLIEIDKSHQDSLWPSDHFIVKAELEI